MVNSHTKPPVSQVKIKQIQCIVTGKKEAQFTVTGKIETCYRDFGHIYITHFIYELQFKFDFGILSQVKKKFSFTLLLLVKNELSIKAHVK